MCAIACDIVSMKLAELSRSTLQKGFRIKSNKSCMHYKNEVEVRPDTIVMPKGEWYDIWRYNTRINRMAEMEECCVVVRYQSKWKVNVINDLRTAMLGSTTIWMS